jgi:hypothetical protein
MFTPGIYVLLVLAPSNILGLSHCGHITSYTCCHPVVLVSLVLIFARLNLLADKYLFSDPNKMSDMNEDGFGSNPNLFGYSENTRNDILPTASTSEESRYMKMGENNSRKTGGSVAALKELVSTFFGY